jgi:hypothetical protein
MTDDDFESQILAFEQAWQRNGPVEIADFLERPLALASGERARLLVELICLDLEFRWRSCSRNPHLGPDERVTLEGYAARFPELGPLDQWPLELLGEEYRVRRQWGDRPTHEEFLSRFHARREGIRAALERIDGELEEESADPCRLAPPAVRVSTSEDRADLTMDVPLLSHHDVVLQRMIGAGMMGKVYNGPAKG